MGNMIIDLQLASENTEGLPSEEQILQWATAAVQPESDNVEMTVRIVDEAESHDLNLTYRGKNTVQPMCCLSLLNVLTKWNYRCWAIW